MIYQHTGGREKYSYLHGLGLYSLTAIYTNWYIMQGKYTGKVTAQDGYGNSLMCVNIDMVVS